MLILNVQNKRSSNIYFENLFNHDDIDWAAIYIIPRLVMHNTYMRSFQYKILNDILYLNEKLHIFRIKSSPLCSFCDLYKETPFHISYECDRVKCLWSDLVQCFQNTLILQTLTAQTVIRGILDSVNNNSFLKTVRFLPITFYLYLSYTSLSPQKLKSLNINNLLAETRIVKRIGKEIALNNSKKTIAFRKKMALNK